MPKASLDQIRKTTHRALTQSGAEDWIAAHVADAVTVAESFGNRICGLAYLESYCRQLGTGRVKGDVTPEVSRPRAGTVLVDAKYGFAQPAFAKALPQALEAARETGIASLAITHAHTCTSLGYFTAQIARAGLVGIGLTNASPVVAAPGGKARVIGTNPISFAVPDGAGGMAMQFDQSTTAVALGKIKFAKATGEQIPEGWAVDKHGQPTTDPAAALEGSLKSLGGDMAYKGWGFGLMAEVLGAAMTGSAISRNVKPLLSPDGPPHDLGQYFILIDPATSDQFTARMIEIAEGIAMDPGARMPGQGKTPSDPIDVDETVWHLAEAFAAGSA